MARLSGKGQAPETEDEDKTTGARTTPEDEDPNLSTEPEDSEDEEDQDDDEEDDLEEDPEEKGKTFDYEYVKKLRTEAARNRRKAREEEKARKAAESKATKLEREKLSKEERIEQELKDLREKDIPAKEKVIRDLTVQVKAAKLGIIDPEVAGRLLDWDELDSSDGEAVEEALKDLVDRKPWLAKSEDDDDEEEDRPKGRRGARRKKSTTSPATPPKGSDEKPTFSRADLQKMTPEEVNKLYDKGGLKEALAEGRVTA